MMRDALQMGATDFIDKPFNVDKLQEAVFKLMEIGARLKSIKQGTPTKEEISRQEKMINWLRLTLGKRKS
jgi:DNA-binding NtrC family response regulator